MSIYIVTFDIQHQNNRTGIQSRIKEYEYLQLCESTYAIATKDTRGDVMDFLSDFAPGKEDRIIVMDYTNANLYHLSGFHDWLEENQK